MKKNIFLTLLLLVFLSACSGSGSCNRAAKPTKQWNSAKIQKTVPSTKKASLSFDNINNNNAFPPSANPGECFAKVITKPQYSTTQEKVLVKDASTSITPIPAKYKTVTKKVAVQEASSRIEVVPATYKWVEEKVEVTPARTQIKTVPASYKTVTEKVINKPAHRAWKKGSGAIGQDGMNTTTKLDQETGEIMCLVDVPATYKTITKQVLVNPASTKSVTIPAKFQTVRKKVIATPATTRQVPVPAKYEYVKVKEIATPGSEKVTQIPAKYKTVTKTTKVSEGRVEWRSILCKTNTTPSKIKQIQEALRNKGYNVSVDGEVGTGTMRAINEFQQKNNLPVDNYLNAETVRALGVSLS